LGSILLSIPAGFDDSHVFALVKDWGNTLDLTAFFDDISGALVLSTPDFDLTAPCASGLTGLVQLAATFHDPITDPESGTVRQILCRVGSACEMIWDGTWMRLP
jgi:hypothetical protein